MKKLLLAILLISCTTESNWPINKKEVQAITACTSSPYYLKLDPKPNRWEAYVITFNGEDTLTTQVSVPWVEDKGLYLECRGSGIIRWEILY